MMEEIWKDIEEGYEGVSMSNLGAIIDRYYLEATPTERSAYEILQAGRHTVIYMSIMAGYVGVLLKVGGVKKNLHGRCIG